MRATIDEIHETTSDLTAENAELLREHANNLVTNIHQVLADRRAVEDANANDVEILAGMAAEIAKLDTEVDPNDLGALQNLVARRDQLARLTKKYGDEEKERLAITDANIASLDLPHELIALIQEARLVAIGQITTAMRPFFSNDGLVGQFLPHTETMSQVSRFLSYTPDHVGTVTEIENAVRDLIQPIASGAPPWTFSRKTILKNAN
jgi:hypothetical protein